MPIIRSLSLKPRIDYVHCFIAVNSAPNVLVSTLCCFRAIQYIGVLLRYIRKPVLECLVMTSPVWLESTYYTTIVNHSPNGWGALAGTSSPKEQTHLPPNLGVEIKYGPPHGHSDQILAPRYGISSDSKQTCGSDGRVGGQSFLYTWLHCEL